MALLPSPGNLDTRMIFNGIYLQGLAIELNEHLCKIG